MNYDKKRVIVSDNVLKIKNIPICKKNKIGTAFITNWGKRKYLVTYEGDLPSSHEGLYTDPLTFGVPKGIYFNIMLEDKDFKLAPRTEKKGDLF